MNFYDPQPEDTRKYELTLPYTIPPMFVGMAIERVKQIDGWQSLPQPILNKIDNAGYDGLTFTQEDLDSIPTPLWTNIASELNIKWE